jgi:diacylglycerol kinase family enzyme
VSGRYVLGVVSNIHLYAGGLAQLSPDARLDDGLMDLWLFEGNGLEDTLHQAWDLWAGRHTQSDRVKRISFQQITLESDAPMFMQVDGEPETVERQVAIRVQSRALRILVPEKAPRALFANPSSDFKEEVQ